jgi:KUP system potassium uptake protein
LLYGDGVITPAISVLSAVEGLKIDAHALAPMVVPITIAILVGLFLVQRKGTEFVGNIFGPVMFVWFVAIALLGLKGIMQSPAILAAISPHHAVLYLGQAGPGIAFAVLGAAFLTLTGAEAMYADMGHFGRLPIQLGWFAIVSPTLMLNYLGQGGLLLADPHAAENPFYLLVPRWAHYPVVAFATIATVIASQAIISGAYSLTQQAMQLGFLPRMRVHHTASHEKGQIYIPRGESAAGGRHAHRRSPVRLVRRPRRGLWHRRRDADGDHHGAGRSRRREWGYNPLLVVAVNGFFLVIEVVFVAANMTKLVEGGWFPLLLASIIAFLMMTWRTGWQLLEQERSKLRQPEDAFIEWVINTPPIRLPGAAAIFTAATTGIPLCLTHHLRHNRVLHERVLHERVLFIASISVDEPRVEASERVKLVPVGAGITRVLFHFGFIWRG